MIIKPGTILYNRFSKKYYEVYSVAPYAKYANSQHTNRRYYYRIQPVDREWQWNSVLSESISLYHFTVDSKGSTTYQHKLPQPEEYKGTYKFKNGIELHQAITGSFKAAGFEVANKSAQILYSKNL